MARLRDPDGAVRGTSQQDWATIAPHTIEEAYEVADAIERGEPDAVRDELGDLLFQVVFQARIAEEQRLVRLRRGRSAIADKLERRHPHVFGDAEVDDAEAQTQAWEQHKQAERVANAAQAARWTASRSGCRH